MQTVQMPFSWDEEILCLWMIFVVDRLQILLDQLRIDLRGGNVAVSKHLLNGAQISTIFKQMSRKAVPERMRRNILLDVCFFLIVLDNFPESLAAHTFAGYIDEKRMLGRNCNHFRPDSFYVLTQCLKRFRINRYDAHLFPAFAANETSGKANVVNIQPNQFADPDTSRIQNLKHGFIPAALHFRNLGLLQEKFNLFASQDLWKLFFSLVNLDVLDRIFFDLVILNCEDYA